MSSIIITKGLPLTLAINLTQFDVPVDLTDGDWTTEVTLRHKTERGSSPFEVEITESGTSIVVDLTSEQTALLDSNDNLYVFVIKVSKTDDTTFLRNVLRASVVDDL